MVACFNGNSGPLNLQLSLFQLDKLMKQSNSQCWCNGDAVYIPCEVGLWLTARLPDGEANKNPDPLLMNALSLHLNGLIYCTGTCGACNFTGPVPYWRPICSGAYFAGLCRGRASYVK